jgi:hypothetical protein
MEKSGRRGHIGGGSSFQQESRTLLVSRSSLAHPDDVNDAVAEDLRTFFAETAPEGVLSAYLYGSRFPAELVRKLESFPGFATF